MRAPSKSFCASVIFLFAASSLALAQTIAARSVEIAGSVGYDGHFVYGGSGVYNLSHVVAVGFGYKYRPVSSNDHVQTYGGFARFSSGTSGTTIPYILAGGGAADYEGIAFPQVGPLIGFNASQRGYYLAFGGGVTILPRPRWGIRPEASFERLQYIANSIYPAAAQNHIQVGVSAFYQFGGRLPQKK